MAYGEEEGEGGNASERTAFRVAEKKYKLYKNPQPKPRKKQQWRPNHPPVDLSEVTDFRSVLDSFRRDGVCCQEFASSRMIPASPSSPSMIARSWMQSCFLARWEPQGSPPIAMFVRTGDVVFMAGAARASWTRIFTDEENAEVSALAQQFSSADEFCFKNYIQASRINLNVRQVLLILSLREYRSLDLDLKTN